MLLTVVSRSTISWRSAAMRSANPASSALMASSLDDCHRCSCRVITWSITALSSASVWRGRFRRSWIHACSSARVAGRSVSAGCGGGDAAVVTCCGMSPGAFSMGSPRFAGGYSFGLQSLCRLRHEEPLLSRAGRRSGRERLNGQYRRVLRLNAAAADPAGAPLARPSGASSPRTSTVCPTWAAESTPSGRATGTRRMRLLHRLCLLFQQFRSCLSLPAPG